jgi:hypothetical protein
MSYNNFDFLRGRRFKNWLEVVNMINKLNFSLEGKQRIFNVIYHNHSIAEYENEYEAIKTIMPCISKLDKYDWFI